MFFNRRIIDREEEDWQIDATRWVVNNFDGLEQIRKTELILPTKEYFPTNGEQDHQLVEVLWQHVKRHTDMADWLCKLEAQAEAVPGQVDEFLIQEFDQQTPSGTFSVEDGSDEAVVPSVTYDPALVSNPMQLISTLAHELAHYLMASSNEAPPDGWELHELATDFLAVFMGFGVLLANSAFQFEQHGDVYGQGWRSRRSGYLTERELVNALSLFLVLKDESTEHAEEHLKPHLGSLLKKARKRHLKDERVLALKQL